jgi:hypothetical protein
MLEGTETAARRSCEVRQEAETGKKIGGTPPRIPDPAKAVPAPNAQQNFTDSESRIMLDGATKSFQQSYNGQIAVDAASQVIVATGVTQDATDNRQLVPMLIRVKENLGQLPAVSTADNGFFSENAITDGRLAGVDLYIATARERKCRQPSPGGEPAPGPYIPTCAAAAPSIVQQMREKLATVAGIAIYKLRKCVVEPVFGQIKEARGFRRFSFRGLEKVTAEWDLVACTHNLLKLFRSGWSPRRAAGEASRGQRPAFSGAVT